MKNHPLSVTILKFTHSQDTLQKKSLGVTKVQNSRVIKIL